jgi:hypothetical protein
MTYDQQRNLRLKLYADLYPLIQPSFTRLITDRRIDGQNNGCFNLFPRGGGNIDDIWSTKGFKTRLLVVLLLI